jgi:coenzyme PQQ biosynthesis protein PqqD
MAPHAVPRLKDKARLRWDPRAQKYLLLFPERGLLLNDDAHTVITLCNGVHDVARIADVVAARSGILDRAAVRHAVSAFLERLEKLGLLCSAPPARS